jgi:hypothetical protein
VSALETHTLPDRTATSKFNISLPSSGSIFALWPKALQLLVVPQGYQAQITDLSQAHIIALALLVVLNESLPENVLTLDTSSKLVISKWTLDLCRRVLKTCRSCFDTPSSDCDRILSSVLCSGFGAHSFEDTSSKMGPLLDLLVEILWAFKHYGGNKLHNTLNNKIHDLLRDGQHPQIVEACRRRLLPLLRTCRQNDSGQNKNEFQVSASSRFSEVLIVDELVAIVRRNPRPLLHERRDIHQ